MSKPVLGTTADGKRVKRQGIGRHERRPLAERFWDKVEKTASGCWFWRAATNGAPGYGIFRGGPGRDARGSLRWVLAHRFAFAERHGPIPAGMQIDHLCRVRLCVNPEHMEVVSHRENTLRSDGPSARQARQTECRRGHRLADGNLIIDQGKRRCRTCRTEMEAARTAKRRVARRRPA